MEQSLVSARMLGDWTFCRRLAVLQHLHGAPPDEPGRAAFLRSSRSSDPHPGDDALAALEGEEVARALTLSAPDEGLIATMDFLETVVGTTLVRPVTHRPTLFDSESLPAELVELGAQAVVLRANGFEVEEGVLWHAESKQRLVLPVDPEQVASAKEARAALVDALERNELPPPLPHSSKCEGCALAAICLPDEVRLLDQASSRSASDADTPPVRFLSVPHDDGRALHVTMPGAYVRLDHLELKVTARDFRTKKETTLARLPLAETSRLSLYGNVQVSTQAFHALLERGIPVAFFSRGGFFKGWATGLPHGNVFVRKAQFAAAQDFERALAISRRLVEAKLRNQRTLLRRNGGDDERVEPALARLRNAARAVREAESIDAARGHEGDGAAAYFKAFPTMLRPDEELGAFAFNGRNRRPPADPVNAALSFCYALLLREWTAALTTAGLDPNLGYLHAPRHGKPALALDLMEEFRPVLADSVVIGTINTGELAPHHFIRIGAACNLNDEGRRVVLQAWERRVETEVKHPVFGYRLSYRRLFELQSRLFSRYLLGELDEYPSFLVR